jgi:hypothetical protein
LKRSQQSTGDVAAKTANVDKPASKNGAFHGELCHPRQRHHLHDDGRKQQAIVNTTIVEQQQQEEQSTRGNSTAQRTIVE